MRWISYTHRRLLVSIRNRTTFSDHYLEVDFDLSEVMWIATANSLIPSPLLDRMEVIRIPGYTEDEKLNIALRYLLPKQVKANGLRDGELKISEGALRDIVRYYTRESGVRNLEREISKICRKVIKEIALEGPAKAKKTSARAGAKKDSTKQVTPKNLEHFLGVRRFDFGMTGLADGVEFVALSMAIYGIAEVAYNLEKPQQTSIASGPVGRVWPSLADPQHCAGAILRGTGLGAILGVLPGGGALLASFAAYTLEKNVARPPRNFGNGDIRGVAAPESANNAGAQTSFIPMLTLGIPGNAVMALMIGALTIHGIQPGPQIMAERPQLFWGMVASMWLGNLMLVIINLPLIGIWVQLLKVPYRFLYLAILLFCAIGVYTVNNSYSAVIIAAFFGVVGFVLMRLECEPAPMILGFVLGPLMEENLRRAMKISGGDPMIFVQRPISLGLLIAAALLLLVVALPAIRGKREEVFQEG